MNQNTSASDELKALIKAQYSYNPEWLALQIEQWHNKQVAEILTRLLKQQVPVVATDLSILGNFFAVPTEAIQAELEISNKKAGSQESLERN